MNENSIPNGKLISKHGDAGPISPEENSVDINLDNTWANKKERDKKEIEIINQNIDQLNREAIDTLKYQIDL